MKFQYVLAFIVIAGSLFLLSSTRTDTIASSYNIVTGCGDNGLADLEAKVINDMKQGWQPVGGIEIHVIETGRCYYQSMTK